MIRLAGVSKSYRGVAAVHPLDLELPVGQTTVLLGPSGCGKSTLLRLMVGLVRPDSGQVYYGGKPLEVKQIEAFRRNIGFVVQDGGLFPHLTARGNAILMARHLKRPTQEIDHRLTRLVELTKFPADKLDLYPGQLSGGQRQRVSLMRALMLDPALILLDEPLGALDPLIRSALQADLKYIFAELKKTVVLVTHDLGEAGYLGDLLILMREGQVVQKATFTELVEHPAEEFVSQFINAQRPALYRGKNGSQVT